MVAFLASYLKTKGSIFLFLTGKKYITGKKYKERNGIFGKN